MRRCLTPLQHALHPLNVWCRLGGRYVPLFRFYERYLWNGFLRPLLNGGRRPK